MDYTEYQLVVLCLIHGKCEEYGDLFCLVTNYCGIDGNLL